jgi:S-adenosylmethionine synthetase
MFGYATSETSELMPLAWSLANELIVRGTGALAAGGSPLRPDGKSQVTLRYVDGVPVGVQAIVLSWQHEPHVSLLDVRDYLLKEIVDPIIPPEQRTADCRLHLNPSGTFTTGGPKGDTGLTGRKIIVDTYGGAAPHGGGAFSGKDPSKVDRSGAYAARWVAKSIVAANLARKATVQLSYAIGISEPVSVSIDTDHTGSVPDHLLAALVRDSFDLTPAGIIHALKLRRPIYTGTSSHGHFGASRDPRIHLWEIPSKNFEELARARGLLP